MVAVVAARHHVANPRLLAAVVVVVRDEDGAEAIDARLIVVAEIVGEQLQVLAVEVAAPDGAGPAIGVVRGPLAALAIGRLQVLDARVADREIELHVRADEDAVDAVIVIVAAKAGEQLLGRAVRLTVAVFVLEDEDVGRMADVDAHSFAVRIRRHRDAQRRNELRVLVKRRRLVRFAGALRIFEDDDAVAFFAVERLLVQPAAVIHRLADPDAALVVDVDAGRIDEQRLGRTELEFEAVGDGEGFFGFVGRELGKEGRNDNENHEEQRREKPTVHKDAQSKQPDRASLTVSGNRAGNDSVLTSFFEAPNRQNSDDAIRGLHSEDHTEWGSIRILRPRSRDSPCSSGSNRRALSLAFAARVTASRSRHPPEDPILASPSPAAAGAWPVQ